LRLRLRDRPVLLQRSEHRSPTPCRRRRADPLLLLLGLLLVRRARDLLRILESRAVLGRGALGLLVRHHGLELVLVRPVWHIGLEVEEVSGLEEGRGGHAG
jgi:hypothetical protein